MKIIYLSLFAILLLSCNKDASKSSKTHSTVSTQEDSLKKLIEAQRKQMVLDSILANMDMWSYSINQDEMTSKKIYQASLEADEKLYFDFPYQGGSEATITIRNKDGVNEIILHVTKGQFHLEEFFYDGTIYDGTVKVRFDDGQPIIATCTKPSDGRGTVLFLHPANLLINKIKKSQRMLIQAEFFHEGLHLMRFNVKKLTWNH